MTIMYINEVSRLYVEVTSAKIENIEGYTCLTGTAPDGSKFCREIVGNGNSVKESGQAYAPVRC